MNKYHNRQFQILIFDRRILFNPLRDDSFDLLTFLFPILEFNNLKIFLLSFQLILQILNSLFESIIFDSKLILLFILTIFLILIDNFILFQFFILAIYHLLFYFNLLDISLLILYLSLQVDQLLILFLLLLFE